MSASAATLIRIGKRAGVTAGFLGVLCVLTEFCFLFPEQLVSHDLRAVYASHLDLFRLALQVSILAAIGLSSLSFVLLRSKAHALLGMLLSLTALALGGWNATALSEEETSVSLGLDYFVLELLVLALLFVPMERLHALHEQKIFRVGWQTDLKYFFMGHVGVQLISLVTLVPVQMAIKATVRWQLHDVVGAQPIVLQIIELLLLVDLVSYWIHRAFHSIPFMWKFHAIHHSSLQMDWLAGSRTHIVDVIVNRALGSLPIFLLGFSPSAVAGYVVFVSVHAVYIHANVRHRWPVLRWVFATPEFHHWHHTSDEEGIDKNFAVFCPLWDVIFRTAHQPAYWPKKYGTTEFQPPESWSGQFKYPFVTPGKTPYG